ncbi:MAG: hypothetical protein ACI4C1_02385 [Lachnospiraceae bacterium]
MGRTARDKRDVYVRPVKKVKLSEENVGRRIFLVILFLVIASGAFIYALMNLLEEDTGWRQIEANASADGVNCSSDFVFEYNLGVSGVSATAESKALVALYTEITEKAYQLFHEIEIFDGVCNIAYINQHPNEVLEIDKVLYEAFETLEKYKNRHLYLAPIYVDYSNLFSCNDDAQTVEFDAYQNEEVKEYFAQVAAFANDTEQINVELLGDGQIKLKVSDEYLSFAEENGIDSYIDFFWMRNAFIIDYIADTLIENHYTLGTISSYDGFSRTLDSSGAFEYSFNLYDRQEHRIYSAGIMKYNEPISLVYFRDYPMNSLDWQHYYEFQNGEIRHAYIDAADGLCKNSAHNVVSYSHSKGCAEVLLETLPIYVAEEFDEEALLRLEEKEIYAIYGKDNTLCYNEDGLRIEDLYDVDGLQYETKFVSR